MAQRDLDIGRRRFLPPAQSEVADRFVRYILDWKQRPGT
jgi:hypothetical protein